MPGKGTEEEVDGLGWVADVRLKGKEKGGTNKL